MQAYGSQLKDFYQRELVNLREHAQQFAQAHPAEAAALGLGRTGSRDPQVEMLVQAFAFLTGRVQYELEASKAALANALLEDLYPHLATPLPCMAIAQLQPRADAADGKVLERGRQLSAAVADDRGQPITCRFRTTSALPLLPLAVTQVALLRPEDFPRHLQDERVLGALRVRVMRTGTQPLKALKHRALRFHIESAQKNAFGVQELLQAHLCGVSSLPVRHEDAAVDDTSGQTQQSHKLRWLGFAEDEAALPSRINSHPGHRLLQEYFAFRDKFMFFETANLDFAGAEAGIDLFFHFGVPIPPAANASRELLKLNCVPLVNLYTQRIDPLALDHSRCEYWLRADVQGHRHCEIHSILELASVRADGSLRHLRPYFELESAALLQAQDYFYVLRREQNQVGQAAGTEVYISFLDTAERAALPPNEVLGGRALCTNRRLPEKMVAGQRLTLDGPAPLQEITLACAPSPHHTPSLIGERPWALVSQLSLNHLSLAEGPQALAALKSMLRCHLGPADGQGLREIDGVRAVQCRPTLRPVHRFGGWGMAQALHVELTLDRSQFEHGGLLLFASVLREFLALYASVNTVVELSVATTDSHGVLKRWKPQPGAQVVL